MSVPHHSTSSFFLWYHSIFTLVSDEEEEASEAKRYDANANVSLASFSSTATPLYLILPEYIKANGAIGALHQSLTFPILMDCDLAN